MESRITLGEIARRAGVHPSTVSLAMRDHPRIPEKTRDRIKRLIEKLGYRPDPALAALNAYRKNVRPKTYQATIGWLQATTAGWENRMPRISEMYFKGAKRRAEELGYKLELFWLEQSPESGRRLSRMLRTRGISGVVLAPLPPALHRVDFSWEGFSAVALGYSLAEPPLTRVSVNHFASMAQIMSRIVNLGYKRPGLAMAGMDNEGPDGGSVYIPHLWEGGYYAAGRRLLGGNLPAPIWGKEGQGFPGMAEWIRKERIDVVIGQFDNVVPEMERLGIEAPRDVALVLTLADGVDRFYAGIDQRSDVVAARAIDVLTGKIHNNERGVPEVPFHALTVAKWRDGESAPAVRADPVKSGAKRN